MAPPPLGLFIGAGYPDGGYDVPNGMYHTLAVEVTPLSKFYRAKATRNFQAEDRETQISFKTAQMLVVVEGVEAGDPWLRGYVGSGLRTDEQLGLFPANHVEVDGALG